MLANPPPKVLSSLSRLNGLPEYKIVLEWLQENLTRLDKTNRTGTGEVLFRNQGAALTLDVILTLSKDASEIVSRQNQK